MRGHRAYSHGGAVPSGYNSFGSHLPDHDLTVVVLANTQGGTNTEALVGRMINYMLGDERPVPLAVSGASVDYVGTYNATVPFFSDTADIAINEEGRLTMALDGGEPFVLEYYGGDRFGTGRGYLYFTFLREQGRVTGAQWEMPVGVLRFAKRKLPP